MSTGSQQIDIGSRVPLHGFVKSAATGQYVAQSSLGIEPHEPWKAGIPQIGVNQKHPASAPCKIERRCQCARSEEHTSELQSLMRTSYAVFCLKKKNKEET